MISAMSSQIDLTNVHDVVQGCMHEHTYRQFVRVTVHVSPVIPGASGTLFA